MKIHLIINIIATCIVLISFVLSSNILSKRQPYGEPFWETLECIWVFGGMLTLLSWFVCAGRILN